ncbi:COP9 signalosome complex subunit 3, partial [Irineochytrium annulatum]
MKAVALALLFLAPVAFARTYFKDTFDCEFTRARTLAINATSTAAESWRDRWIHSRSEHSGNAAYEYYRVTYMNMEHKARRHDYGPEKYDGGFNASAGSIYAKDAEMAARGLQTDRNRTYYAISAQMHEEFDNKGKDLVLQFSVKFEHNRDCVGGYIRLMPVMEPTEFSDDTPYNILFGPELCRFDHWISLNVKHKNNTLRVMRKKVPWSDRTTHLYTLIIRPDDTYQVLLDGAVEATGYLRDAVPAKISDPTVTKPADWVDQSHIPNPNFRKCEGPFLVLDPNMTTPADSWDDELFGEWEPPMVVNPELDQNCTNSYLDNPEYKGSWVHPEIDNPDYGTKDPIYHYNTTHIGFEFFQFTAGTIFDNIIISDSIEEAKVLAEETFFQYRDEEKAIKEALLVQEKKRYRAEVLKNMMENCEFYAEQERARKHPEKNQYRNCMFHETSGLSKFLQSHPSPMFTAAAPVRPIQLGEIVELALNAGNALERVSKNLLPALRMMNPQSLAQGTDCDPLGDRLINPTDHSLAYLYILVARFKQDQRSPESVVLAHVDLASEFSKSFDARQVWLAPDMMLQLGQQLGLVADRLGMLGMPVGIIRNLLLRSSYVYRVSGGGAPTHSLTTLHPILMKYCLLSKMYSMARPIVMTELTSIEQEKFELTIQTFLLYHYYGGMVLIGLKEFGLALDFFHLCISAPANACSAIQVEAHRKHILVSLLHTGHVTQLPKYTSQVVTRSCASQSQAYADFAKAFESGNPARVAAELAKHLDVFTRHRNFGLARQCMDDLVRREIIKLTRTYLTLSLVDIAKAVGIEGASDVDLAVAAEREVLRLVDEGKVFATISHADGGMVSFHDAPD